MYQEKIMLITGAYRGIGKMIATYFASLGVNIILTYHHHKDETLLLEEKLKKYNVDVSSYYLDLASEDSIKDLFNKIKTKYNSINYLVNNASLSLDSYLYDKTKEEFMRVLEVNVIGTFLMIKYFDSIVDGFIFNMSSTDGIDTGSIYSIDYNVSKAGIDVLTKTFSLESKNKIISICPNWVDTDSTNEMFNDYLESELKRIKQDKLINVEVIPKVIDKCIKENNKSGSIIRIEGDIDGRIS